MEPTLHHDLSAASDRSATLCRSNHIPWVIPQEELADVLRRGIQALDQPTVTSLPSDKISAEPSGSSSPPSQHERDFSASQHVPFLASDIDNEDAERSASLRPLSKRKKTPSRKAEESGNVKSSKRMRTQTTAPEADTTLSSSTAAFSAAEPGSVQGPSTESLIPAAPAQPPFEAMPPGLETLEDRLAVCAASGYALWPHDIRGVQHDLLFLRAHLREKEAQLAEIQATSVRQDAELEALTAAHADLRGEHEWQVTAHDETRRTMEGALLAARTDARDAWLEAERLQHALDEAARTRLAFQTRSTQQFEELSEKTRELSSDLDAQMQLNVELQAERCLLAAELQEARTQATTVTQACTDAEAQRDSVQLEYAAVLHDLEVLKEQALSAVADADAARHARDIMRTADARTRADRDALLVDLATAQEDLASSRTALAERTRVLEAERDDLQEELCALRSAAQAELQLAQEHWASDRTTFAERTFALELERDAVREELRDERISHQGELHSMRQARDAALAAVSLSASADLAAALDSRNDSVIALITVGRFARGARMALVSVAKECDLARNAAVRRRVTLAGIRERLKRKEDCILKLEQLMAGIQHLAQPDAPNGLLRGRLACIAQLASLHHAEAEP